MKSSKMFGAAIFLGSTLVLSSVAQAACPPEGCPKGYACAGNPIYSTCVKVEKKKTKSGAATNASPVVLGYVL